MTQTIITLLPFKKTIEVLRDGKARLQDNGTFFVICSTEYDSNGNVLHDFLDVISEATGHDLRICRRKVRGLGLYFSTHSAM